LNRFIEIRGLTTATFREHDLPLSIGGEHGDLTVPGIGYIVAYIGESEGFLFLQPIIPGLPVFVNDELIDASVWLKSGDICRFGETALYLTLRGNRTIIELVAVDEKPVAPAAAPPPVPSHTASTALPRVEPSSIKQTARYRFQLAVFTVLALLASAALFLVAGVKFTVRIEPPPEHLSIDGFPPVIGVAEHFFAIPGKYKLSAGKEGYRELREEITVSRDQPLSFYFSMAEKPAIFTINSSPQGAAVFLNENKIGTTPLESVEIEAGSHRLELSLSGYLPVRQTISTKAMGERRALDFSLTSAMAEIIITSDPASASVTIDDVVAGVTPFTARLEQGEHIVRLTREQYREQRFAIEVIAGQNQSRQVKLTPKPALVKLTSTPAGALALIGERFVGITPVTVEVDPREAAPLVLRHSGYKTEERRLTLTPDSRHEVNVELKRKTGTIFISGSPTQTRLRVQNTLVDFSSGKISLPVGRHELLFSADGYQELRKPVTVRDDFPIQITFTLTRLGQVAEQDLSSHKSRAAREGFIFVENGAFIMGAARGEAGRRANEQQRSITFTRAFYVSQREVSNREFRRFRPNHDSGRIAAEPLDGDTQPAVNVSWDDAARYANWRSVQENLSPFYQEVEGRMIAISPPTAGYRLPTEAEWEYLAAHLGRDERNRFPWPGTFPPRQPSGNFADESARRLLTVIINDYRDGFAATAPVGSFAPNKAGAFDLGGNVSEWCHDYYTPYFPPGETTATDPLGPPDGRHHVIRDSSWRDATITELRLSFRGYGIEKSDDLGFRLARYAN
jgi:formylglycine-generating enzyme required for sulfatase activity